MNINEGAFLSQYSDDIYLRLLESQSHCSRLIDELEPSFLISAIEKRQSVVKSLEIDLSCLDAFLESYNCMCAEFIKIIFHCPFSSDTLPGNFYMPKMSQSKIPRAKLINAGAVLTDRLAASDIPTIIVTTRDWLSKNFLAISENHTCPIVPVFVDTPIDKPMFTRHAAYTAIHACISSQINSSRLILSFHDSDLLQIRSWGNDILQMKESRADVFLTYRWAPNLLPINGGLFFAKANERATLFMSYTLVFYDYVANDPRMMSIYQSDLRIWDGDQVVLNAFCDWFDANPYIVSDRGLGINLGLLPARRYNYAIKKLDSTVVTQLREELISGIHLKGQAKENLNLQELARVVSSISGDNLLDS